MFDHPIFPALKRWAIFSNKRRQIRPYNSESFQTEPLPNPEGETGQRLLTSTLIRRSCCVIGSSGAKRRRSCRDFRQRPLIENSPYLWKLIPSGISGGGALSRLWLLP